MDFVDNIGNIFYVKSYDEYPIGYEFENIEPIFWFDTEYSHTLSVDNWFVKPIRFVFPSSKSVSDIDAYINSDIFKLYSGNIDENLNINESELIDKIENIDGFSRIDGIDDTESTDRYTLFTAYAFCMSKEEGTWISQMLLHVRYNDGIEEWCPISLGASFSTIDECLQINARNFGTELPKEVIRAVWEGSYTSDMFDSRLYNIKLKEYLLNYMDIKGNCGNYNSALSSLEWFGWGDRLELSRLMQTDNVVLQQFIHDYFSTESDIIESFKHFKTTSMLSLHIDLDKETGRTYDVDDSESLWGEGKPELESLIDKDEEIYYDDVPYIKKYLTYSFNELAFKLACLADMYKKYFLPIHISIESASLRHKVFANDTKLLNSASLSITETPLFSSDRTNDIYSSVSFADKEYYQFKIEPMYIDTSFCRFDVYNSDWCSSSSDIYYSTDNYGCIEIPLSISAYKFGEYDENGDRIEVDDYMYNISIVLRKGNKSIFETSFSYSSSVMDIKSFVIVPPMMNIQNDSEFWNSSIFTLDVQCNGSWYSYDFTIRMPEPYLRFGKLKYSYDSGIHRQIERISDDNIIFNSHMLQGKLASIDDINFWGYMSNIIGTDIEAFDKTLLDKYIKMTEETGNQYIRKNLYSYIAVYDLYSTDTQSKIICTDPKAFESHEYSFSENTINLYRSFFNDDGTQKYTEIDGYDMYLMKDMSDMFYVVFISKEPLSVVDTDVPELISMGDYELRLKKVTKMFLIDRMDIEYADGRNIFSTDDIVVSQLYYWDLPADLRYDCRWKYRYASIGKADIDDTMSKTNIGIMHIPTGLMTYKKGYYDVELIYSIDGLYSAHQLLKSKICIE